MAAGKWEIKDGKLPPDLAEKFSELAKSLYRIEDGETPLPPWLMIPEYGPISMGWRMGSGQEYLVEFVRWFRELEDSRRVNYMNDYPEPVEWSGFYDRIMRAHKP